MNTCPYCSMCTSDYYRSMPTAPSYIRILHASPGAPAVDIYVNNTPIIRNLGYKQFSNYLPIVPGTYNIKVYAVGTTSNPVLSTNMFIPGVSILTIAAIGIFPNISLLTVADKSNVPLVPGKGEIRFVHLSPDTPAVDVTLPDGKVLFKNAAYKQIKEYILVDPGNYTLQLKAAGTDKIVLHVPNIRIRPRQYYTVYAVGLLSGNPPLQALIPLDGNSYLNV